MKMPMFMTDRYGLNQCDVKDLGDGRKLYAQKTISDAPGFVEPENSIKMQYAAFSLVEAVGDDLHLVEFMNADMKGYVPPALMNMILGSMASHEYIAMADNLREIKAMQ